MKTLQSFVLASALTVGAVATASAGLAPKAAPQHPAAPGEAHRDSPCPASTFDVYFRAFDSEVSAEAKALLIGLALAYRACPVQRIEIESLAVESASPDSTPDIAAARAENLAGLLRLVFLGRTDVVVRIAETDDGFGPEARRAQVRLVT